MLFHLLNRMFRFCGNRNSLYAFTSQLYLPDTHLLTLCESVEAFIGSAVPLCVYSMQNSTEVSLSDKVNVPFSHQWSWLTAIEISATRLQGGPESKPQFWQACQCQSVTLKVHEK